MADGSSSRLSASEQIPQGAAFFDPCADRARGLDARMRHRLADSVAYVAEQVGAEHEVPAAALGAFLARVRRGPIGSQAFGAYYDWVLALEAEDLEDAARHLADLLAAPACDGGPRILMLGDAARERDADRYRRHVDTDPGQPVTIVPPPPAQADAARALIDTALARLDAGHPALAAEIRALLREIVLAVGSDVPGAWTFEGASAFTLWGAVVLNVAEHTRWIGMAQALAHESAHNLLFGLCADGPLLRNDDSERYASPLRVDPRPLDGIFHATFVTARMHQAVARLLASGVLDAGERDEARDAVASCVPLFEQGLATLDAHAKLTPLGEAVLAGARAYMARGAW